MVSTRSVSMFRDRCTTVNYDIRHISMYLYNYCIIERYLLSICLYIAQQSPQKSKYKS